ncbi:MAG TPA: ferritin-like domain-containing protein [Thermoleophilaceae bacterium]|nr:ferritin-like domain-containing protein [Thermoleophilaceae bacterium]
MSNHLTHESEARMGQHQIAAAAAQPAAPELEAVEFEPLSRGALIARGALGAAALYGAIAAGPLVRRAFAQMGGGDVEILNFALTLEYLEAAFYERALDQVDLGSETTEFAETILGDENEHVAALEKTIKSLGGKPVTAPMVEFPFSDEAAFLKLAQTLEDTGVAAYDGAAPAIESKELLATAGSIVQVEARHAARIRLARNQPPAPNAFDPTLTQRQVLKAVAPFVKA